MVAELSEVSECLERSMVVMEGRWGRSWDGGGGGGGGAWGDGPSLVGEELGVVGKGRGGAWRCSTLHNIALH